MMSTRTVIADLRRRKPGKALRADHLKSRAAAVELFCAECMGGSTHAAVRCDTVECVLFPHAFGRVRPDGVVPTEAEYRALLDGAEDDQ